MNDIPNERRAERKQIDQAIPVEDVIGARRLGRIGNISRTGLMLMCREPLNNDAIYQIRFTLPDSRSGTTLEVGVHEQWTEEAATAGQHWSGVRIIAISAAAEASLEQWLSNP